MPDRPTSDDPDAQQWPIELRPVLREAARAMMLMVGVLAVAAILMFSMMAAPSEEGLTSGQNLLLMTICGTAAYAIIGPSIFFIYLIERRHHWLVYEDRIEVYNGSELIRSVPWDDISQVLRFDSFVEFLCKRPPIDESKRDPPVGPENPFTIPNDPTLGEHLQPYKMAFVDRKATKKVKGFYVRKYFYGRARR